MKISKKVKIALRSLLMKCGAVSTDKATLLFEGEELEIGTEVFVENEEGEISPAEDGEYVADGVTYVVAEGKVAEIRKEEEAAPEEEETPVEEAEEPEAEPIEEPEPAEEAESVEDRVARLESAVGEIREGIEGLIEAVAALAARVESMEEKMKGLEEPAADPAEDTEETQETASRLSYLKKRNNK